MCVSEREKRKSESESEREREREGEVTSHRCARDEISLHSFSQD